MPLRSTPAGRPTLAAAVLAAAASLGVGSPRARADAGGFPPLLARKSTFQAPGKFVFTELVTPDLAGAERFYGALFGWSFRDVPVRRLRFAEASSGGRDVAGLIERPLPTDGARRPAWLPFLATGDTDGTAAIAVKNGGRVLFAPRDIPGLGREAVLADPEGGVFAVLRATGGDPADTETPDDDWIWSALLTPDPARADAFYGALFGYQSFPAPGTDGASHLVVAAGGYARASINALPDGAPPDARARWIRFVRVDDVGAAAATAVSLGGRVLVQPHDDRDGGRVAVLADPSGAVFGVLAPPDGAPTGAAP